MKSVDSRFVKATAYHARKIAPHIRASDVREIQAMTPLPIGKALEYAVRDSERAWAWVMEGHVICLFGVAPLSMIAGSGSPWMVATEEIYKHRFYFARKSRMWFTRMRRRFNLLWNQVPADDETCIRWLRWLGCHVREAEPAGRFNEPFRRFEIVGGAVCATQQ
jgi:hypothetical protein